jgi:hypothetical protein
MDDKTDTCDCDECRSDPIAAEYARLEKRVAELEAGIRAALARLTLSSHPHCRDASEALEQLIAGDTE